MATSFFTDVRTKWLAMLLLAMYLFMAFSVEEVEATPKKTSVTTISAAKGQSEAQQCRPACFMAMLVSHASMTAEKSFSSFATSELRIFCIKVLPLLSASYYSISFLRGVPMPHAFKTTLRL